MRRSLPLVMISAALVFAGCSGSNTPAAGDQVEVSPASSIAGSDTPTRTAPDDRVVWAIGDSIMVAATEALVSHDPDILIEAETGRRFSKGLRVLEDLLDESSAPDTLVFALGTNNGASVDEIDALVALGEGINEIILVNVVVPRGWEQETNSTILQAAAAHSTISFVDWNATANGEKALFRSDGYHPSADGALVWAEMIAAEIFDG